MGRVNARDAGSAPGVGENAVGLVLLGLLFWGVLVVQVSVWVSSRVVGIPESVSGNPFVTVGQVVSGKIPWTPVAVVTLVVLCVVALVLLGLVVRWRVRKSGVRVDSAADQLASRKDIESLSKESVQAKASKWFSGDIARRFPGLRLGKVPGSKMGLYSSWEDLYLIIFGPRMGKTTSQVIPAIVDAPGVVVTTSNKRDIVDDTIGVTAGRGQVFVFDPQRIAVGFEQEPWFFDPLDVIRRDSVLMDAAAVELADIFKTAALGAENSGDAYFSEGGRDLLARYFLAAAIDDRPVTDVFRWLSDESDKTPLMILRRDGQWLLVADALQGTYAITEKTRSGLFAQALLMAAPLGRREAAKWVTASVGARRFVPDDFVRSGADTLYVLSKEGADNAAALTTALTAAVMKAAERYGEENGGRLPVPLVAALDEAANVVKWPQLPQLYSHYGSRSIILMTILQSYAQGVGVWGEEGMEALWSASSILLYGGGVRDEKMLTKLEALIGDYQEWSQSVSYSDGKRSVSKSKQERKILTVSELASLGDNRAVVFAAKRRPIVVELEPFWVRDYWPGDVQRALSRER